MQKKIIALAVVAAAFSAPAFADTNVYGLVDAAVVRAAGDGQKSDMQAVSGGLAASRLGVKHTEVLDGGLTAVVVLEYGLDTEVASGLTTAVARQQMLAVAGDFGTLATGYLQTTGYDFSNKFDPTSGSSVSPLGNITKGGGFLIGSAAAAKRAQRALAYISPDMGGVTVAVNYATDIAGAGSLGDLTQASAAVSPKVTALLISATYTGGSLAVGGVYAKTGTAVSTGDTTEYSLGASYDLSVVKLSGTYQSSSTGAAGVAGSANTAASLGVTAPVGSGTALVSYAKSTVGTATNSDASGYTVGYLQGLSKTTTAYVAYSVMSQGTAINTYSVLGNALGGGALTLGGSSSVIALGLNKKF